MSRRRLSLGTRRSDTATGMARQKAGEFPWGRLLRILLVLAVFTGVGWGIAWTLSTPVFSITNIATGSYRYSAPARVEATLQPVLGKNIWRLDEGGLRRDLEALPWVQEARILKRWPGTVEVQLQEWRPVLMMEWSDSTAPRPLLVEDGRLLGRPADVPPLDLPEFVPMASHWDSSVTTEDLTLLMEAVATVALEKKRSLDYIILDAKGFSFLMEGGSTRLVVGDRDYEARLRMYLSVVDDLQPSAVIDLRFDGKISLSSHDPGLRPTAMEGATAWSADN